MITKIGSIVCKITITIKGGGEMIYISQLLEQEKLLQIISSYSVGLEVISFSIGSVLDRLETSIDYYDKEFLKIREQVLLTFHGPFLDLFPGSCDQRVRCLAKERFEASYKASQAFNVHQMIFHTGYIPNYYPDRYWLENTIDFWQEFLEDKLENHIFYIENVLDPNWEMLKQLVDQINHPHFKICLDVGHVNVYSEKSVLEWIEALGERIGYVHLHNNEGIKDSHRGLLKGDLPMKEILSVLKNDVPNADWSLEIGDEKELRESLEWLYENFDTLK